MRTNRFNPPDLSQALERQVGSYRLALVYRNVGADEGPTVHVFGPVEDEEREILRFDCFRNSPHFHLGFSYLDQPVQTIEEEEPLTWVLAELQRDFPEYLERSQADNRLPEDWQTKTAEVVTEFAAVEFD